MSERPRVLFVTPHAFNATTGGGITFSSLFRGWPAQRIATVHSDPEPTTGTVCQSYFVLGGAELDYAAPLRLARRALGAASAAGGPCGPTACPDAGGVAAAMPPPAPLPPHRRALTALAQRIIGDGMPQRARLTPRLAAYIEAYRPDLLYTILGSNGMMRLIAAIRERYRLPSVVHFMDDWMSANHRAGLLAPAMRAEMQRLVAAEVDAASALLGISPAMCDAFAARYGRPFTAFQNAIDMTRVPPRRGDGFACREPADIVYVGSIFANAQLESLARTCRAVAALNEGGYAARLTISSPSGHAMRHREQLQVHPAIRIIDTIRDDDAFFARIGEADLLLLPVGFDEAAVRFIRYSMPTKLPAYLSVGTPILAYGPAEVAQIAYAISDGWAFVLTEPGEAALVGALKRALGDTEGRARVSAAARACARRNHDAADVRARFQDLLCQAAGRTP